MRAIRFLVLGLASASLAGCVTVAPYERELLTHPAMNTAFEQSESDFRGHVHESREGSIGGSGATGGGCGCN